MSTSLNRPPSVPRPETIPPNSRLSSQGTSQANIWATDGGLTRAAHHASVMCHVCAG